jgi:hypothetical protein
MWIISEIVAVPLQCGDWPQLADAQDIPRLEVLGCSEYGFVGEERRKNLSLGLVGGDIPVQKQPSWGTVPVNARENWTFVRLQLEKHNGPLLVIPDSRYVVHCN